MPVLVASRPSPIARGVVEQIAATGGEVRAYGPEAGALRGLGAIPAVGDLDDEGRLEAAMAQVHTVVHLPGGVLAREPAHIVAEAQAVATAAANAGVRRLLTLTLPGATPQARDPLRRAHGDALAIVAAAAVPTVVVQTSLIDTPALRDALASLPLPPRVRERTVAPVRAQDAVALLVAFDELRSEAHEGHVRFHADGPARLSLGAHLDRVGVAGSRVGRVYRPAADVPLLTDGLDGPWVHDEPGASFDAWEFTGVRPRPVSR